MYLLLLSLKAIECICTQERSNTQTYEKASHKSSNGNKRPGTEATIQVSKKACHKKDCNLCQKHGGPHTMHNTKDCRRYEKNRMEKSDIQAAKNGAKKPSCMKQSLAQLSKKMEKLMKVMKKQDAKRKKHCCSNGDSNSE